MDASPPARSTRQAAEQVAARLDVFELGDDVLSLHDLDGSLSYVSAKCTPILGDEPRTLLGTGLTSRVHPHDRSAFDGLFTATVGDDQATGQVAVRIRRTNGGWAWVELNARAATLVDGERVVALVWRDVTARRQLESFGRLLQRTASAANQADDTTSVLHTVSTDIADTLDWAPVGVWRVEPGSSGAISSMASAATDPAFSAAGDRVRALVRERLAPACEPVELAPASVNHRAPGVVGLPVVVAGQVEATLVFAVDDVADFDATLAELATHIGGQLSQVLEREHHLEALKAANAELERSNAELEQFAYVASHDLQEPLRKVASFCTLLERRYAEQLDDDAREFIGYAVDGAERMQRLINDLLAYSRVGRGGAESQAVPLGDVVQRVLDDLAEAIEDTDATVHSSTGMPAVMMREDDAVALVSNLMANALKFHVPGAAPSVQIEAEARAGWVTLSVSDDGIGIADRHQERIFGIFQRLHAASAFPGTGIGLALCRRIAQTYGGEISCVSSEGEGTTFVVTLPAAEQGGRS